MRASTTVRTSVHGMLYREDMMTHTTKRARAQAAGIGTAARRAVRTAVGQEG